MVRNRNDRRQKNQYTCLKCFGKQFNGARPTKHHIKNYHKAKSREDINQFFLDWIINPVPIL
jgi:hypothetical protein